MQSRPKFLNVCCGLLITSKRYITLSKKDLDLPAPVPSVHNLRTYLGYGYAAGIIFADFQG